MIGTTTFFFPNLFSNDVFVACHVGSQSSRGLREDELLLQNDLYVLHVLLLLLEELRELVHAGVDLLGQGAVIFGLCHVLALLLDVNLVKKRTARCSKHRLF